MAVEAASLLHDMGKLAIPEHILNKPGKLTAVEFEIMKVHASVGADILAAIEFPYPVVPIVRHHHENWDGSGYPDRLAGTDIPIGARILSVVDCFDALTSDRPYRSKLTDKEAIAILKSSRGTMYDPLVIDTFVDMHAKSAIPAEPSPKDSVALTARIRLGQEARSSVSAPTYRSVVGPSTLPSSGSLVFPYSIDVLANYVAQVSPGSLLVLYVLDESTFSLGVARAWGRCAAAIEHLRIPLGKRLTGRVAASCNAAYDADPSLDFAGDDNIDSSCFRSCTAMPVAVSNQLLGVLTIYLPSPREARGFEDQTLTFACAHASNYFSSIRPPEH